MRVIPGIFDIVYHQRSVVDYLTQSCDRIHLLLSLAIQFRDQHAEYWPPSFASTIDHIPDRFREALGETGQVCISLTIVDIRCELGKILLCLEAAWDDIFHDPAFLKAFPVTLQYFLKRNLPMG